MAEDKALPPQLVKQLPVVANPEYWRIAKNRFADLDIMWWFPGQVKVQLRTGKDFLDDYTPSSFRAARAWPFQASLIRASWKVIRQLERHERKERRMAERKAYEEALKKIERNRGKERREARAAKKKARAERKLELQVEGSPYLGTSKNVPVYKEEAVKKYSTPLPNTSSTTTPSVPMTLEERKAIQKQLRLFSPSKKNATQK